MKRRGPVLISILALTTLMSLTAFGQVSSSISGVVHDPNGEVVSGATVIVKNTATGAEFRTTSSGSGVYTVPSLGSGTYIVTVSAPGFKQAVARDVKLDIGVPATVNLTLEVGAASESVVVQGGGEIVQTQTANIATTLQVKQITNLPLISRNASDFITMLPGVNTPTTARNSTINGLPQSALNITIDGINVQDNFNKANDGFYSRVDARLDAIEEVTISTATPGAESSAQGAIQIKYVTRQGSNQFHGSVYEYHRNPSLNANYWFNNRDQAPVHKETGLICGTPQQPFDGDKCKAPRDRILFNQFGFRVGGPIILPKRLFGPLGFDGQNKAFFFVNYEEFRFPSQVSRQRTILSPDAQKGIFRYNVTVNNQTQVREVNLLELAKSRGQISTIDPVIGNLLADIRNSTTGKGGIQQLTDPNLQRFTFANPSGDNRYFPTLRLDFNLNEKHHLEASYNYQENFFEKDIFNGEDPSFPGFPNFGSRIKHIFSGAVAVRSTLSQSVVNEARVGLSGGTTYFSSNINSGMFTGPVANQAGFSLGLNAALINNATTQTNSTRRNAPLRDFSDNLNWTRGAHSLSFGGSFTQASFAIDSQTAVPAITFGVNSADPADGLFSSANFLGSADTDRTRARNLYAVLTGRVTAITANAQLDEKTGKYFYLGKRIQRGRQRELGFFAQDAWRARPNLTINYGLRWELQLPFTPLNDSYTTTTGADLFGFSGLGRDTQFVQYRKGDHGYNTDYKNFGPSFGFAWSIDAKRGWLKRIVGEGGQTVLRGGYAIAYTRQPGASFSNVFGANPGSFVSATRSLTNGKLVTNQGSDRLPVLLRETNRLSPAPFPSEPTYPLTGDIANSANIFDPNLKVPYVQSWSFGIQREIAKDTAIEVRYVGNRQLRGWTAYDLNEPNIVENGFLDEFKLAQKNLEIFKAANPNCSTTGNPSCSFAYRGLPGQEPLPIILAFFSGLPASESNKTASYISPLFASTTFVNSLAFNNPAPFTFASNLYTDATRRNNAFNQLKGNLPANLFLVNPGLQGGANFTGNGGYFRYDSMVVELRRRLSKGLLAQGSYVFAKGFSSQRPLVPLPGTTIASFRRPRVNALGGTLTHAFKVNWVYELPFGRGKTLFGKAGGTLDRIIGGWEFDGAARVQSGQLFDFGNVQQVGNVQLVGMTRRDLQKAFKLRFDDAKGVIYSLPQDIIDNTIRAFSVSATTRSGYPEIDGVPQAPTGRYIAPANSAGCIQVVSGDCAPQNVNVYGPMFTRFDLSAVKRIKIKEGVNFELRGEFLNAFNNVNFFNPTGNAFTSPTSQTFMQVTEAYRDSSNTNDPGGRLVQIVARINF
jgi:Carboxypeptidase regulatory-like domain/TonB-dependent Receptor Plug Domain